MITATSPLPTRSMKRRLVSRQVEGLAPSGIRRFFDLVMGKQDVISLGVGEPDFATPWHICEAGIHSLETGRTSYTSNSGLIELREEISAYFQRTCGQTFNPQTEILVTVGGSEAVDLAFRTIVEPGDEVIVVDPSFVSYAPLAELAGAKVVRLSTSVEHGFTPDIHLMERAVTPATRSMIVNYPNNPTGAALTREGVEEIAEFVLKHDLILISDEIYHPLSYDIKPVSFASLPELRNRLILIHGFSKAWAMTGWRLGIAAGPAEAIAGMTKVHQYCIMSAPTTAQFAAIEALRHGDDEVERMRQEYDRRRRFFVHHLNRIGLDCFTPTGAFYAFPCIRSTGMSSLEFAEKLLDTKNVAVVPGEAFGQCGEGYVRCSYATSLEQLREAIHRIEAFVKNR